MAAPLPLVVKLMLAARDHRLRHYIWHGVRNSWLRMNPGQRQAILAMYPGWEPPRPALDANGARLRDNNSGEDFLYMHRQMTAMVNENLARQTTLNDLDRLTRVARILTEAGFDGFFQPKKKR
jgi:hypothetical protein